MTIIATTMPAMKVDAVYTVAFASGLFGSAPVDVEDRDPPEPVSTASGTAR